MAHVYILLLIGEVSYHHIELSKESQPKSAFTTPMGKSEFTHIPFGLAQVQAYFQRLVKVFTGLDFAFRYLDDIIVFGPDVKCTWNT